MEESSLEKYLMSTEEKLLKSVKDRRKRSSRKENIQKKQKSGYGSKALHGQFQRGTRRGGATWDWLKKGYLKKVTHKTHKIRHTRTGINY